MSNEDRHKDNVVSGIEALEYFCKKLGINPNTVTHLVIDIPGTGAPPIIRAELFGSVALFDINVQKGESHD